MNRLMGLPLRLRIFLFFGLMAVGAAALAAGSLAFVWSRAAPALPSTPFVTAFIIFAFLNVGLLLVIWLLFDEYVARPVDGLSTNLRLRAHSGVDAEFDSDAARYLGDLAPAAQALSNAMEASVEVISSNVSQETVKLRKERERLTSLLSEIPIATILVNASGKIVLYDAQAAAILAMIAPPRLRAPLTDYFDVTALEEAKSHVGDDSGNRSFELLDTSHSMAFNARLKSLGDDGDMVFIDVGSDHEAPPEAPPLVFDFDLLDTPVSADIEQSRLADLCFVVFDTETTGLSVETDEIVQIAALRVLNSRIVEGEVFESYVNPGRPIPLASTKIHGVTDADVVDAPNIGQAGLGFHKFARDSILVAHNAPFDIGLLRRQEQNLGEKWDHPVMDTVLLSAVVFGTTADHSLDALCDRLGIEIPENLRHTALGDTRATAEAVVKLLPLVQGKGIETFGDLIRETRRHSRLLADMNPK